MARQAMGSFWNRSVKGWDVFFVSAFVIAVTFHPYYLHRRWELFELSLYLPGINSILHGGIPFRDFFHLRGPFEVYIPAVMMKIFSPQFWVLVFYHYAGNVLSLLAGIWIARELLHSRLVFYAFAVVLTARTFPRVVFAYWGGFRFAFGLLSLWFLVLFLKRKNLGWLFAYALTACCSIFTSVEVGVCAFAAGLAAGVWAFCRGILPKRDFFRIAAVYAGGAGLIALPVILYFAWNHALVPYGESGYAVVTQMVRVFDPYFGSASPQNFGEALALIFQPFHPFYQFVTPVYFFIFWAGYLIWRVMKQERSWADAAVAGIGVYALVMYAAAFRSIGSAQFEMSLQPEKILFFYFIGQGLMVLMDRRQRLQAELRAGAAQSKQRMTFEVFGIGVLVLVFLASSFGYALKRFSRRFFAYRYCVYRLQGKDTASLRPLAETATRPVKLKRLSGMVVPQPQAEGMEQIAGYLEKQLRPGDSIFVYPDQGIYHFILDRPFVGRFPVPLFSWLKDSWHRELMRDLERQKPAFVVWAKKFSEDTDEERFFSVPGNKQKYQEMKDYIFSRYRVVADCSTAYILKRRDNN